MSDQQHQDLGSTLQRFGLTERDVLKPVSKIHLQEISRAHCRDWRSLPAALMMENDNICQDIEREEPHEEARRRNFFSQWKSEKSADANYKKLINAFLEANCKEDAEYVCSLLKPLKQPKEECEGTNVSRPMVEVIMRWSTVDFEYS